MAKVNIKSEKTTPFRLFYYSYVCRQENIILFIYITQVSDLELAIKFIA